jgi:hypothetical protein
MTIIQLPAGGEIFPFAKSLSPGLKWLKHEVDLMPMCLEIMVHRNMETISAYIKFESFMAAGILVVWSRQPRIRP